jgi:hypothetical protein
MRWLLLLLIPGLAHAHEMSMAELELRELSRGQFVVTWGVPGGNRPIYEELQFVWPEGCAMQELSLKCRDSLTGPLQVQGVGERYSAALVRVIWLDGDTRVYTLTASQPSVQMFGAAEDGRSARELALAYLVLGIEHILGGIDHLLFVIGLLFLVGFRRRLIGTITAFTIAHSITLALSVLGVITLRSAPVEASIALSIVLVASEALRSRETLTRRLPALVAFLFGLVHGLGFAGALKEVGLPQKNLALPLFTFNVGVELGQLMTVLAAYLVTRLLANRAFALKLRTPTLYAIGIVAAYWSWQRLITLGA